jgi:hypothetical protein
MSRPIALSAFGRFATVPTGGIDDAGRSTLSPGITRRRPDIRFHRLTVLSTGFNIPRS